MSGEVVVDRLEEWLSATVQGRTIHYNYATYSAVYPSAVSYTSLTGVTYPDSGVTAAYTYQECKVGISTTVRPLLSTANDPMFAGHFPGAPVMPGVLIVEAMAQTGGLLMSKSWNSDPKGKIILFMSVDNCRFRLPVRPGDVLRLNVKVMRARANVVKFAGRALVGERLAAEADFAAMLVDAPE